MSIYLSIYLSGWLVFHRISTIAPLAGAVEYTDCCSAEGYDPPTHTHNEYPGYDTKQSDGEVPVMQSTPSQLLLSGPPWPRVVAPDSILSMSQIELNCMLMQNFITRNRTVFDIETVLMIN